MSEILAMLLVPPGIEQIPVYLCFLVCRRKWQPTPEFLPSVYIGQWALRTGRPVLCWLAWAPASGTGHSAPHLGLLTRHQLPLGTDCMLWPSSSISPLQKPMDPPQPHCSCIEPREGPESPSPAHRGSCRGPGPGSCCHGAGVGGCFRLAEQVM